MTRQTQNAGTAVGFLVRSDIGRIAELEAMSYADPWDENRLTHHVRKHPLGQVISCNGVIVAYALYALAPRSITIHRLAVQPLHRRNHFGSALIVKLKSKLAPMRRRVVGVYVRETNLAAQLFLRAHGFLAYRLFRGAYRDSGEDAIAMAYQLDKEAE